MKNKIKLMSFLLLAFVSFTFVSASEVTGTLSSSGAQSVGNNTSGSIGGTVFSGSQVDGTLGGGSISGVVVSSGGGGGGGGGGGFVNPGSVLLPASNTNVVNNNPAVLGASTFQSNPNNNGLEPQYTFSSGDIKKTKSTVSVLAPIDNTIVTDEPTIIALNGDENIKSPLLDNSLTSPITNTGVNIWFWIILILVLLFALFIVYRYKRA